MELVFEAKPVEGMAGDEFWATLETAIVKEEDNIQLVQNNLEAVINALFGTGVLAGTYTPNLVVAGTGLNVTIKSHISIIGMSVQTTSDQTEPVAANSVLWLWELQNNADSSPQYTTTITNTNPGTATNPAILLAKVTTNATIVTAVDETVRTEINGPGTGTDLLGFVPIGACVPYNGDPADLPDNWQIADGTNGTIDMRNRFVYGASETGGVALGALAGANNHVHTYTTPSVSFDITAQLLTTATSNDADPAVEVTDVGAGNGTKVSSWHHDHGFTIPIQSTQGETISGSTDSTSNLPQYVALYWIQRMY